jgi:hypothetical protein
MAEETLSQMAKRVCTHKNCMDCVFCRIPGTCVIEAIKAIYRADEGSEVARE